MPDSAAEPTRAEADGAADEADAAGPPASETKPADAVDGGVAETAAPVAEAPGPALAQALSQARQGSRFLHWMSVPGQQELRTRLENPPPPLGPLFIFFLGVPAAILGVFIHTSVALVAIFFVAVFFIAALVRAREANMRRRDGVTFTPATAKVEAVEEGRALVCLFQPESPGEEWRGLAIEEAPGGARLRLPWDERMAGFEAGGTLVFVVHAGRVLVVEDAGGKG